MKKTLAVLFTAMALVGCDDRNAIIENERETTKDALNAQKEAVEGLRVVVREMA